MPLLFLAAFSLFIITLLVCIPILFPILFHFRNLRYYKYLFKHLQEKYVLEEAASGLLADFLQKIQTDHRLPPIRLYFFSEKVDAPIPILAFHPLSLMRMPSIDCPFGFPVKVADRKFPVFIPRTWENQLLKEDLEWIICHEIGHLIPVNRWKDSIAYIFYPFFRPGYFSNIQHYLDREARSDYFAVGLTNLEQSITTLRKIGLFAKNFDNLGFTLEIFSRIAMLKNKFS